MRGRGPWWKDRFNESCVRITAAREIILEILSGTEEHLSAADVYIKAHAVNPAIGLTTVYRTLDLLEQMGIAQKFDFGDGHSRFELINNPGGKGHHHHLVCMSCKKIIDYSDFIEDEIEFIDKTQRKLSKKHKFNITGHSISFYGTCEICGLKA